MLKHMDVCVAGWRLDPVAPGPVPHLRPGFPNRHGATIKGRQQITKALTRHRARHNYPLVWGSLTHAVR